MTSAFPVESCSLMPSALREHMIYGLNARADWPQQLWSGWRCVCCCADRSDGLFRLFRRQKTQNMCQKLQELMPVSQCVVMSSYKHGRANTWPQTERKVHKVPPLAEIQDEIKAKLTGSDENQKLAVRTNTQEIKESGTHGREEQLMYSRKGAEPVKWLVR